MNWLAEKLHGWKTIIVNGLLAIVPLLDMTEFRDVIPASYLAYYSLFVVLANVWLRHVTTGPVAYRKPEAADPMDQIQ